MSAYAYNEIKDYQLFKNQQSTPKSNQYSSSNTKSSHNNYNAQARSEFNYAEQKAREQARKYAQMQAEDFFTEVLGFAVKAAKTVLMGQEDKSPLHIGDYIKSGFFGFLLTLCVIISFTGIGAIGGVPIGLLLVKGLSKDGKFIGLVPFIICTIVTDVAIVIFIVAMLSGAMS